MREFFELFREKNSLGYLKLDISQSYREKWNIKVSISTNGHILIDVSEYNMDLAFAKAYTQLIEHVYNIESV